MPKLGVCSCRYDHIYGDGDEDEDEDERIYTTT